MLSVGALVLFLVAAALPACGSSGDSTSSGEPQTLTITQYVQQADIICRKADARQSALLRKLPQEQTSAPESKALQEVIVLKAGIPPLKEEAAELDELGVPAGKEKQSEEFLAALEKAIAEAEAEPIPFAEARSTPFASAEQLGAKLGLQVCGRP
jgi:hypothetical protein